MALATSEICGLEPMGQGWTSWVSATFNLRATQPAVPSLSTRACLARVRLARATKVETAENRLRKNPANGVNYT